MVYRLTVIWWWGRSPHDIVRVLDKLLVIIFDLFYIRFVSLYLQSHFLLLF